MQIPSVDYPNQIPVGDFPYKQQHQGWICTKCGRSNAPWVSQCPCSYNTIEQPKDICVHSIIPPLSPIYDKPQVIIGDPLPKQNITIKCKNNEQN